MAGAISPASMHWHRDLPGARWFRADLHVHTLDDFPGGRVKISPQWSGKSPADIDLTEYARVLLQTAISRNVQVLGLTPHNVRTSGEPVESAVCTVVEEWKNGKDSDGAPFRQKIYAVYPGFEISFTEGKYGVHLQFLFDHAIGPDQLDRLFHALMGAITPWVGNNLQNSPLSASEAFEKLDDLLRREEPNWDYLCLAPHAFTSKGLFDELKGQVSADFPHHRLAALELPDDALPEKVFAKRPWLGPGMKKFRHGFFHASDSYELGDPKEPVQPGQLGYRVTMLKLASATIEALRQAFLASDCRTQVVYRTGEPDGLVERNDLPDPLGANHPWLRRASVKGGNSFFRRPNSKEPAVFDFNPGLTCVIGGRMTGKSTLLDGIRVYTGIPLPRDQRAKADVRARGKGVFLAGDPEITLDFAGQAAGDGSWPARFFTQRELQLAVGDQEGFKHLLFHLVPGKGEALDATETLLEEFDERLAKLVARMPELQEDLEEAEQALHSAQAAKDALSRYAKAGADRLKSVQSDKGSLQALKKKLQTVLRSIANVTSKVSDTEIPKMESEALSAEEISKSLEEIRAALSHVGNSANEADSKIQQAVSLVGQLIAVAAKSEEELTSSIVKALVESGGSNEDLVAFEKHKEVAAGYEEARQYFEDRRRELAAVKKEFENQYAKREDELIAFRDKVAEVAKAVNARFEGRILIDAEEEGVNRGLEDWIIAGLHQRGITRWWNAQSDAGELPTRSALLSHLSDGTLDQLGMSGQVVETFRQTVTDRERYRLRALRCPDRYTLDFRLSKDPLKRKPLQELSGGLQVAVLLTLLLEVDDPRPLVVDQPEDELDNSYLFEAVLPVLRQLKDRRQIVFATHNPNIVVNGDADHVIALSADYETGRVRVQGAIEEEGVRNAIIEILDGGREAFILRHEKYGF